ncbi:MAG: twin-arginine translocase subunit TatC, partial [Planctomycetota bacterium]
MAEPALKNVGDQAGPDAGRQMTFGEHLEELRKRVMVSVIVVGALFFVCFYFHEQTQAIFILPYKEIREALLAEKGIDIGPLNFIDPTEAFTFTMTIALYSALILGMPVCLHQMWAFIGAGLHRHERRAVMRVLPVSFGLFAVGILFCFMLVIPIALEFLVSFVTDPKDPQIQPSIRVNTYLSFVVMMCLLMGAIFQLPLLQVVLAKFNLMSAKAQAKKRKAFIMAAVVICAIVTPTGDAMTLILVTG